MTEEATRTADHLEMLQEMLADDQRDLMGEPQVTTALVSFALIEEVGDLQLICPEEHTGRLFGVRLEGEPTAIIADYQVWQHGPTGEDGEPLWSNMLRSAPLMEVPVRLIDEIWGAVEAFQDFGPLDGSDQPE